MINFTITNKTKFQEFSSSAAFVCALLFAFFIPISTAIMNTFLFFTLVFIMLSGDFTTYCKIAWNNPISRSSILLFLLFLVGTSWSIVEYTEAFKGLKKYNSLWYIALLLPLFNTKRRKEIGIKIFLASMTLILIITYAIYFNLLSQFQIPVSEGYTVLISIDGGFKSHIITNILMSFAMFIFAHRVVLYNGWMRALYLTLLIASFYYAIFISTGTTGQILAIGLSVLFLYQHLKWKSIVIIPLLIGSIFSYGQYNTNTSISNAINKIHSGIKHDGGSASHRREFLENSIFLIQKNFWLGSGTGSIEKTYSEIPKDRIRTKLTTNPHNEYMALALQLGLTGVISFLFLLLIQYRVSKKLSSIEHRYLSQGLIALVIVASLGNSMLMDSGESHFWAFFVALLLAPNSHSLERSQ